MNKHSQTEFEKKVLDQFMLGKSLFGKDGAFAPMLKNVLEKALSADIDASLNWADLSKNQQSSMAIQLAQGTYKAQGKSTFKEEFVTAGGVDLKEINFKKFESKLHNNLFLIGEVINVDAVTGGFNFQNAWTGGWVCAKAIAKI